MFYGLCTPVTQMLATPRAKSLMSWKKLRLIVKGAKKRSDVTRCLKFWSGMLLSCEDYWKTHLDVYFGETFLDSFVHNFENVFDFDETHTESYACVSVCFVEAFLTAYLLSCESTYVGISEFVGKDVVVYDGWRVLMYAANKTGDRDGSLRQMVDQLYGNVPELVEKILTASSSFPRAG
jgi:hypothetical protein